LDSTENHFLKEAIKKMERYCVYQERCHLEVQQKMYGWALTEEQKDTIIVHLIAQNFLNEERFALEFTISKFHQKKWGKVRLENELKSRKLSNYLIKKAIDSIPNQEYEETFHQLAEKTWNGINEKDSFKKRKKVGDFLLRKGYESDKIYEKIKELK